MYMWVLEGGYKIVEFFNIISSYILKRLFSLDVNLGNLETFS